MQVVFQKNNFMVVQIIYLGQGPGLNNTQKISWISLAPQEIKAIQTDLMQAGYLGVEEFFLEQGAWQDNTAGAMYSAMVDANLNMIDVYSQLTAEKNDILEETTIDT